MIVYAIKMSTIFGKCIFIYFRIAHTNSDITGFRRHAKLLKCKTMVFPDDDREIIARLFDNNDIGSLNSR